MEGFETREYLRVHLIEVVGFLEKWKPCVVELCIV